MILVNLAEIAWSGEKRRNAAMFEVLVKRRALFDGGVYIDPPQVLPAGASISARIAAARQASHPTPLFEDAVLFRPCFAVPFAKRPPIRRASARILAGTVLRHLADRPFCLLLNNIEWPAFELFEALAPRAAYTVIDVSDDWTTFTDREPEQRDARLASAIDRADAMIAVNAAIAAKFRHRNPLVFGNGTDVANFQLRNPDFVLGDALPKRDGRKIIGFVGGLNTGRVDEPLLDALFARFPEALFLFVGYSNDAALVGRLRARPNVRFFEAVSYAELPFVISAFDVGIVPHLDNAHTRGNDLLKVMDYLATGVPVVSTDCSNVRDTAGTAVAVASNHAEFLDLVAAALAKTEHDPAPGRSIAATRDWKTHVAALESWLAPSLRAKSARPAQASP